MSPSSSAGAVVTTLRSTPSSTCAALDQQHHRPVGLEVHPRHELVAEEKGVRSTRTSVVARGRRSRSGSGSRRAARCAVWTRSAGRTGPATPWLAPDVGAGSRDRDMPARSTFHRDLGEHLGGGQRRDGGEPLRAECGGNRQGRRRCHPVRPGGNEKKPAVRLLLGWRLLSEDFRRYHPLGEVVSTDKVDSVGNRKTTRDGVTPRPTWCRSSPTSSLPARRHRARPLSPAPAPRLPPAPIQESRSLRCRRPWFCSSPNASIQ